LSIKQTFYRGSTSTCLLLAALVTLAGCEPSQESADRAEAEKAIAQATEHMDNAASGGFHTTLTPESSFDIDEYRVQQLNQATQALSHRAVMQSPSMRTAAASLSSNIATTEARSGLHDALEAWTMQTARATRLIGLVSAIQNANVIATEQAKVNANDAIASIRQTEKALIARNDGLQAETQKIKARADALRKTIDDNLKARQAKIVEADEISRQAYTAKGQMQYDLYLQASASKTAANQHASKANLAEAELSIEEAQLKLNATTLASIKEQVNQARQSIELLSQRSQQSADQASAASELATEKAGEFDEVFKQFAQQQLDGVTTPLQTVNEKFEQAISQSQSAMAAGVMAAIHHNVTRAEYGAALGQQAMIHDAYAQTLQTLVDALGQTLPNRVSQIRDAIAAAKQSAATARETAKTHLTESDKELENLTDGGAPNQRSIVLRNRIAANHTLARVNNDGSFLDTAKALEQQLNNPNQ
jgi:hypothetical protein